MKFIYFTGALLAALVSAVPLTNEEITVEPISVNTTEFEARSLDKRFNAQFAVWPTADCEGVFYVYDPTGNGAKADFSTNMLSAKVVLMTAGWHLTLYSGLQQSGSASRIYSDDHNCHNIAAPGVWESYGLYSK